jgi:NitT/TauT family transport system substrate-binding protein
MQSASLITIGSYPTTLNAASMQRVADLMFNFEVLPRALNVRSMIPR